MTDQLVNHSRPAMARHHLPFGSWAVDRRRSEVGFAAKDMWGLRTVHGAFRDFRGALHVGPRGATGELTIEADSLDTGNRRRDDHLRSPAFFDVEQHPRISFSAAVAPRNGGAVVSGDLLIGFARVPLEIPVDVDRPTDDAVRLEGEAIVSRAAAGLAWNKLGMIRGDAIVHARLTLERDASHLGDVQR